MKEACLWLGDVVGSCFEDTASAISSRTLFPVVDVTCTVQDIVEHECPCMSIGILPRSGGRLSFCLSCSSSIGLGSRFLPGREKIEEPDATNNNHKKRQSNQKRCSLVDAWAFWRHVFHLFCWQLWSWRWSWRYSSGGTLTAWLSAVRPYLVGTGCNDFSNARIGVIVGESPRPRKCVRFGCLSGSKCETGILAATLVINRI